MANLSDRNKSLTFVPSPQAPDSVGSTQEVPESATVPDGWLEANGQAVSRTTYADLFALYGTTFGVGDGSTTFNLPGGSYTNNLTNTGTITSTGEITSPQAHFGDAGGDTGDAISIQMSDANRCMNLNIAGTSQPTTGIRIANSDTGTYTGTMLLMSSNQAGSGHNLISASNSGGNVLTVRGDGNVGIGTTSPGSTLHVVGTATIENTLILGDQGVANGTINCPEGLVISLDTEAASGGEQGVSVEHTAGLGQVFRIDEDGAVRVRTTNWATGGTAIGFSGGTDELTTSPSSIRYKDNVQDLHYEIDTASIYNLRPVTFDYKVDNAHSLGYIAEEVYDHIPAVVHTRPLKDGESEEILNKDGVVVESVRYDLLTVFLLEEMKKMHSKITALENQLNG